MDLRVVWFLPVFFMSLLFVAFVIPAIVKTANRMHLFDTVDDRKVHVGNVPRLGGISFFPAILFSLFTVISVMTLYSPIELTIFYGPITEIMLALAGCVMLYLTGIMDDIVGVSYKAKFLVQVCVALIICASGLWISDLYGVFGIHKIHPLIGYPLTILIIVLIINSINLIDGIDGLASGLCILGTLGYTILFFYKQMNLSLLLSIAMLGVLLMFYFYNVFGKPGVNKIFMGDTGSLTMGYLMAFFTIKLCCIDKQQGIQTAQDGTYLVYALSLVLIPMMDVFRVFFARIRNGKKPFYPDKRHIHHKFMALGYSMRQTRFIIFALSVFFLGLNMFLFYILKLNINWVILICAVVWIVFNLAITRRVCKLVWANDPTALKYAELGESFKLTRKRRRRN